MCERYLFTIFLYNHESSAKMDVEILQLIAWLYNIQL